jgi:hypothetical protein
LCVEEKQCLAVIHGRQRRQNLPLWLFPISYFSLVKFYLMSNSPTLLGSVAAWHPRSHVLSWGIPSKCGGKRQKPKHGGGQFQGESDVAYMACSIHPEQFFLFPRGWNKV